MLKFPLIRHIDDVLPHIQSRPEFIMADKGDYVVINYLVAHNDSFLWPEEPKISEEESHRRSILRECRGLIFSKDGHILSRRLHKFKNLNEADGYFEHQIDWNKPHVVLEKLDGSMISSIILPTGDVRWATKMGITDVGEQCYEYVHRSGLRENYERFAHIAHEEGTTPIFEYIAPSNRIVIPYEEEKLILLAVRKNATGEYMNLECLKFCGEKFGIPVVKTYSGDISDVKDKVGIEGVVVRFEDGHMIKCKTSWYIAIHKAKENILFEKNVVKMILEEKIDDVFADLPDSDKERLSKYKEELIENIDLAAAICGSHLNYWNKQDITRKEYVERGSTCLGPRLRPILLKCYQRSDLNIREEIVKMILKHCTSQSKLDEIRDDFLPEKW